MLLTEDNNTTCIDALLKKTQEHWYRIARIVKNEGSSAKAMTKFYLATVQAIY